MRKAGFKLFKKNAQPDFPGSGFLNLNNIERRQVNQANADNDLSLINHSH